MFLPSYVPYAHFIGSDLCSQRKTMKKLLKTKGTKVLELELFNAQPGGLISNARFLFAVQEALRLNRYWARMRRAQQHPVVSPQQLKRCVSSMYNGTMTWSLLVLVGLLADRSVCVL